MTRAINTAHYSAYAEYPYAELSTDKIRTLLNAAVQHACITADSSHGGIDWLTFHMGVRAGGTEGFHVWWEFNEMESADDR